MEYDDSDFQVQNLHLAGEENTKFSPALCPYALPKFDFDGNLQGHLRFDSLVENEVFLGIPSQEDSQWIEDFSRGSNCIESSSSAPESCTISRHNNVWSEATSSKSVEMLLKSVGQEQMVPEENIVEESGGNELGTLTKQTEPDLEPDVKEFKHADELQGNSRLIKSVGGEQSHPYALQSEEAKLSAHGNSIEPDPNVVSKMHSLCAIEENLGTIKCNDVNRKGIDTSIDESLSIKMQEKVSLSVIPVRNINSSSQNLIDNVEPSSENVIASLGKLYDEEIPKQVSDACFENASGLPKDLCIQVSEQSMQIMGASRVEQIATETCNSNLVTCGVSSSISLGEDGHGSSISESVKPFCFPLEDHELQIAKGHSEDGCSRNPAQDRMSELVLFPQSIEIKQLIKGDLYMGSPVSSQGDLGFEGHASVMDSTQEGILANVEMKVDAFVPMRHGPCASFEGNLLRSDIQTDIKVSVGDSEPCNFSGDDNKAPKQCDRSSINDVDNFASLTGSSLCAKPQEQMSSFGDASDVLNVMLAGSKQLDKLNTSDQDDVHICDQDVSFHESRISKFSNMKVKIVGSVDSEKTEECPFLSLDIEEKADVTDGLESDIASENPIMASHGTVDSATLISGTVAIVNESGNCNEEPNSAILKEGFHLDEKEDMEAEAQAKTNLLAHKDSSQYSSGHIPTTEVKNGATIDCEELQRQIVNQSFPVVEHLDGGDAENPSEQIGVANEATDECFVKRELCQTHSDSTVKEGDSAKEAGSQNHEAAKIEKNCKLASLKESVDCAMDCQASFDLAHSSDTNLQIVAHSSDTNLQIESGSAGACGCDCTELSHSEKDKNGGGLVVENVPLPKVVDDADEKVQSYLRENDASKEERSFSFDVSTSASSSVGKTIKDWQSLPTSQACRMSTNIEGFASAYVCDKLNPKVVQEIFQKSPQVLDGGTADRGAKATPKRRNRRNSAKSGEENAKKGSPLKETILARLSERGDKSYALTSHTGSDQLVQLEELKPYRNAEQSGRQSTSFISAPATNLLDLNNLATPTALFQQPFTDLQQVQLRAQIFVYGSLIQGAVPDVACMISAFGPSDGGRRIWEPSWNACNERLAPGSNYESPVQLYSGTKISNQPVSHGSVPSKVSSSTIGGASSKDAPSPVINPMISLSSPLWNISTPTDSLQSGSMPKGPFVDYHHSVSPLHTYQTPPVQNYVGCTTSWLSQAPIPNPWFASPQNYALDDAHLSAFPITEAVKLTTVKESSVPIYSGPKHASSVPVVNSGVSSSIVANPFLLEMDKVTMKPSHHSTDVKARKRKQTTVSENLGHISTPVQTRTVFSDSVVSGTVSNKITVSDGIGHISLCSPNHIGLMSAPVVSGHFSKSVAVINPAPTVPSCISLDNSGRVLIAGTPTSISHHTQRFDHNMEEKNSILEETFCKVDEARLQADAAASLSASAFGHCQGLWSQLDREKDSKLVSEVEAKLGSAAVLIAAAASVAKAAAAAANVASNVSAQAKLMVEEALSLCGTGNLTLSNISLSNFVYNLLKAFKGGDGRNLPSSRSEVASRVETTSVLSKSGENIDSIVKAAELAAEAVSQVGKIVSMGDPLPLSVLVEAGPEGYWKALHSPNEQGVRSNNMSADRTNFNVVRVPSVSEKLKERPSDKEAPTTSYVLSSLIGDGSTDMSKDRMKLADCISASAAYCEKDTSSVRASKLTRTNGIIPDSQIGSKSAHIINQDRDESGQDAMRENNIREGCHVEVYKEDGRFKRAWFSANVLSLKDGKAFVTYTELQSEGAEQLKEWIPLEGEGTEPPIIRIAHPMTNTHFEGTRKRHRVATRDYAWSIGDRVDVWMEDCWCEGVVTEKNKKDETMLTIHFTAQRETSTVRAWHLRPTIIWKDGVWTELFSSREEFSSQGDTPQGKRLKLAHPFIEGKYEDKMSKNTVPVEGKHENSRLLPLSMNERVFNIGKSTRGVNKPEAPRTMRSGIQKEGSRVVFGIPKPGKKRKFMEVSKHYVSDKGSKNNAAKHSVKFMKYPVVTQGPGFHVWKNNFGINSKEKQLPESKSKAVKFGKGPRASGRSSPLKDELLASVSAPNGTVVEHKARKCVSNDENDSQQNLMGFGAFSKIKETTDGAVLISKPPLPPDVPKKVSTSNAKSEHLNPGKLAPAGGESSKYEIKDKSIHELVEPRRSIRRIQPTSRLLEGLQSSLIISKTPAVSHDKNHRFQNRSTIKGNNAHG